jgi:hypothetical protein
VSEHVIQWGYQYLLTHGYTVKSAQPETVVNTPWSSLVRFATFDGDIYLKHTPEALALEAPIIELLRTQFHAAVPNVIAHNSERHCFLMKDAGRPLRDILKQQFDTPLCCKAVDQFTSLQLATADYSDVFLKMGVPDWRLEKLPNLYNELLAQKNMLIEDGLSEIEITQLKGLLPTVVHLCEKLSRYPIQQTIVQPDFNDNNMLIDPSSQQITTIDLGEIVISHPFFSLINCLQQLKKHHGLTETDVRYLQIKDACFKNFSAIGSEDLFDAVEIAKIVFLIYAALANYRLMLACDKVRWMSWKMCGRVKDSLKAFIAYNRGAC